MLLSTPEAHPRVEYQGDKSEASELLNDLKFYSKKEMVSQHEISQNPRFFEEDKFKSIVDKARYSVGESFSISSNPQEDLTNLRVLLGKAGEGGLLLMVSTDLRETQITNILEDAPPNDVLVEVAFNAFEIHKDGDHEFSLQYTKEPASILDDLVEVRISEERLIGLLQGEKRVGRALVERQIFIYSSKH